MLVFILGFGCNQVFADPSVTDNIIKLCKHINVLDARIFKTLKELPKYEGEYVVKDMKDYNNALSKLGDFLANNRNETLGLEEAVEVLREGAPDYFEANIDPDKGKLNFGWLDKGLNEIFALRAESIEIWSKLNRMARVLPLEYYSYPENVNYTGYQSPLFPPLREKMERGHQSKFK